MNRMTLFFGALFLSLSALAESQVTAYVTLFPAGSFQAVSKKVKGTIVMKDGNAFTAERITVNVESMKTGIELRDEHFWKHLQAEKHQRAILSDVKAQNGKATGVLEVAGVKKPVNMTYTVKDKEIVASFTVKNSDFKLPKAEYLGVGVDDTVKVEAVLPFATK